MITQTDNQLIKEKTEKPQIKNNYSLEPYCKSNKREKKPILSLDDLLEAAQDIYKFGIKRTAYTVAKTTLGNGKAKSIKRFRYDPLLPQIIEYIMGTGGSCTSLTLFDNKYAFPNVSGRRLKRSVQKLVKLRWLLRTGRGGFAFYWIHPYLRVLVERWDNTMMLAVYSGLKLSLEDCLNMPLFNALNCGKKITSIENRFREFPKRYYDIPKWLHGEAVVSGKFEDGSEFNSLLWVNYHAGSKIIGKAEKGYKGKGKGKPKIDFEGNPHYTLPLKWALWGIRDSKEYCTKNGHYDYVHYDSSLKEPHAISSFTRKRFTSFFGRIIEDEKGYWSNKETCQYSEFSSFSILQKQLEERFVNGKTEVALMDAMGMKASVKPIGRPKGSINKPKPNYPIPKRIDLMAMLAEENT